MKKTDRQQQVRMQKKRERRRLNRKRQPRVPKEPKEEPEKEDQEQKPVEEPGRYALMMLGALRTYRGKRRKQSPQHRR